MTENAGLALQDIHKTFDDTRAVYGVSFQVREGEILGLLGPSGSGKTTILEIIAGIVEPDRGKCTWKGKNLADVPPYQRGFGLMFQDFALFPHKNVRENVSFGLKMQNWPGSEMEKRVRDVLELVGLPGFGDREVDTLSGGEQQRVALARSLAPQPRLLMLDEPIGSLDRTLRERLMGELREILKSTAQTAIYVTHDQQEAFSVADRIVVLREGRVAQTGRPEEIYRSPDSTFVARFLGLSNILPGKAQAKNGSSQISTEIGTWQIQQQLEGDVEVLIRPDAVRVGPPRSSSEVQLLGTLSKKAFSGKFFRCEVLIHDVTMAFEFPAATTHLPSLGEQVKISFDPDHALQIFPA